MSDVTQYFDAYIKDAICKSVDGEAILNGLQEALKIWKNRTGQTPNLIPLCELTDASKSETGLIFGRVSNSDPKKLQLTDSKASIPIVLKTAAVVLDSFILVTSFNILKFYRASNSELPITLSSSRTRRHNARIEWKTWPTQGSLQSSKHLKICGVYAEVDKFFCVTKDAKPSLRRFRAPAADAIDFTGRITKRLSECIFLLDDSIRLFFTHGVCENSGKEQLVNALLVSNA